jgi:hypothetical protein
MKKYTCPCCGYKTLDEEPPGTYAICPICFWEDDLVQFKDPDYRGGANHASLREAQQHFVELGYCENRCVGFVRKPTPEDEKDPEWKQLTPPKREDILRENPPTFVAGPDGVQKT